MNFLSKTLSTFTGTSIPYTFKEKIVDPVTLASSQLETDQNSIWTLYNGVNPKDSSDVSIFEFSLCEPKTQRYELLARNAFKKLKLIKFPGIISIIDFIENDSHLYIITERVLPLSVYLGNNKLDNDALVAGLYSVENSLKFINDDCNSVYGGLNFYNSVFVNRSGDWKLMGFEIVTNLTSDPDQPIYRLSQSLPHFQQQDIDHDFIRQNPKKFDGFKLACFVYAVFNGKGVVDTSVKLPVKLVGPVKRLYAKRSTIAAFVKELEAFHQSNKVIQFDHQLYELHFMNDGEKITFFKYELPQYIEDDIYPPGMLNYKLLPELIRQYKQLTKSSSTAAAAPGAATDPNVLDPMTRQETLTAILNLIVKFGTKLTSDEFNKQIKPIIFESFNLADRAIRLVLLTHLPAYQEFLSDSEIQSKIFTPLITGFQDTNFMIRETTLKSITIIIDKISVKQVNQELLRILAKSQMDPKPSIRVNTLILIIKISSKIYSNSKNNVLITALSKSLRDSFVPCKITALNGFKSLIDEFSLEEICSKILGHLAISLMDKASAKVRHEAKDVFDLYLSSVETHAKELPNVEPDEDEEEREFYKRFAPKPQPDEEGSNSFSEPSNSNAAANGGYFGWGVVNKLTSFGGGSGGATADIATGGQLNKDFNQSTPDITRIGTPTQQQLPILETPVNVNAIKDTGGDESGQGWDDDFNEDWLDNDNESSIQKPIVEPIRKLNLGKSTDIHTSTPGARSARKPLGSKKPTSLRLGHSSKANPNKPKPTLNLNLAVDAADDGEEDEWGDGW
ncbi:CEX1 [Candida margitis]|uniref:CEX1 n=1 Tax=Candida margitis TaxID=1775924 RepID=UPI002226DCEE|nr:CEX1 [Candida margitis]KAI5967718.1 CEX1 [Candida margitis]